jgi:hypothetical protein
MFTPKTAPATTAAAATAWAAAYVAYIEAGGIPTAATRQSVFADALTVAFNPELAGAGIALFVASFNVFWIGLVVPAQAGTVVSFIPVSPNVSSPEPDNATPQQQANGLATVIATLTLGSVLVQPFAPGPPVPLL